MDDRFQQNSEVDGIRFNWNVFPSTRLEASSLASPLGCLYTPLHKRPKDITPIPETEENPICCSSCGNYINPFIKLDRVNMMWWCPFCEKRSFLPDNYKTPSANSNITAWPIALRQTSNSLTYKLPEDIANRIPDDLPYTYLFIIDIYVHIDELNGSSFNNLISSIIEAIDRIPLGSTIGLITFEESVNVHRLFDDDSVTVSFNKDELFYQDTESDRTKRVKCDYNQIFQDEISSRILRKLKVNPKLSNNWRESPLIEKEYLITLTTDSKLKVVNALKNLKPKLTDTYRPNRSSGLSLHVATTILSKSSFKNFRGKIIFLTNGPCTNQPGLILNLKKKENLRSHSDIVELKAPNFLTSSKFYQALSYIANGQSSETANIISNSVFKKSTDYSTNYDNPRWTFDLFTGSLDQVGIYEMKSLVSSTMGNVYLFDSFSSFQFKQTLINSMNRRYINAKVRVTTSPGLKILNMISNGYHLPSSYQSEKLSYLHHEKISDTLTKFDTSLSKKCFTNQWLFNTLNDNDTLSIFFEMDTVRSSDDLDLNGIKEVFIQLSVNYWDLVDNCWKLRVTTVKRPTTLSILINNQVKLSNGSMKIVNSKSKIVKERDLLLSFDQTCWVVLLTRLLINKIDTTLGYDSFDDLIKLIDETLVKLLFHFGGLSVKVDNELPHNPYIKIQQAYEIHDNFKLLPSLIYNLRKSPQLIRIFNSSPDETAYYHNSFLKLSCDLSVKVIEPTLYKLIDNKSETISLDSFCLALPPKTFIMMDSVFNIIIYYIKDSENYLILDPSNNDKLITDNDPRIREPLNFIYKNLINADRPIPKFILTQTNHSQSRFLISRLNPIEKDDLPNMEKLIISEEETNGFWSLFRRSKPPKKNSYDLLMTDDISLKQYYEGLIDLIKSHKVENKY